MWHEIEYEGFDGSITHDLAKERENGSFPWFIIRKRRRPSPDAPTPRKPLINRAGDVNYTNVDKPTALHSGQHE